MNRKQRSAVVIGAVAILLLALFPPWRASITVNSRRPEGDMSLTHLLSEGDPSATRQPDAVIETGVYALDGFRWIGASASRAGTATMNAKPFYEAAISLQLAALALTVAAVVVLREREP